MRFIRRWCTLVSRKGSLVLFLKPGVQACLGLAGYLLTHIGGWVHLPLCGAVEGRVCVCVCVYDRRVLGLSLSS